MGGLGNMATIFRVGWDLMVALEPAETYAILVDMGYLSTPCRITRERRVGRERQQSDRNVYKCFVLRPEKVEKSALLDNFIRRKYSQRCTSIPTTPVRFAANTVKRAADKTAKTLVLMEIPEDELYKGNGSGNVPSYIATLADCDLAIFVYHRSDKGSLEAAKRLYLKVSNDAAKIGFPVSCVFVASHGPESCTEDFKLFDEHGILEEPATTRNIFMEIVDAAEQLRVHVPDDALADMPVPVVET